MSERGDAETHGHRHTSYLDVDYEPPAPPGERRRTGMLIALILGSVVLAAVAQLTLKYGVEKAVGPQAVGGPVATVVRSIREPIVLGGFVLFGLSALLWIVVLSRASLSFAYPFASLTYVLILLFDKIALDEPVSLLRWGGVALIIAGLVLVSRTHSG